MKKLAYLTLIFLSLALTAPDYPFQLSIAKGSFQPMDVRYTIKKNELFAFIMDKPTQDIRLTALGKKQTWNDKPILHVHMLGSNEKLAWSIHDDALVIKKPARLQNWKVHGFKIVFKS